MTGPLPASPGGTQPPYCVCSQPQHRRQSWPARPCVGWGLAGQDSPWSEGLVVGVIQGEDTFSQKVLSGRAQAWAAVPGQFSVPEWGKSPLQGPCGVTERSGPSKMLFSLGQPVWAASLLVSVMLGQQLRFFPWASKFAGSAHQRGGSMGPPSCPALSALTLPITA